MNQPMTPLRAFVVGALLFGGSGFTLGGAVDRFLVMEGQQRKHAALLAQVSTTQERLTTQVGVLAEAVAVLQEQARQTRASE